MTYSGSVAWVKHVLPNGEERMEFAGGAVEEGGGGGGIILVSGSVIIS